MKEIPYLYFIHCKENEGEQHDYRLTIDLDSKGNMHGDMICQKCGYCIEEKDFQERIKIVNQWFENDENVKDRVLEKLGGL